MKDLARHATFEGMVFLLWHDVWPDAEALYRFSGELAAHRELERHTLELLRSAAARRVHPMDALRMAARRSRETSLVIWSPPGGMRRRRMKPCAWLPPSR